MRRKQKAKQHYQYTFDEARIRGWINCNIERYRLFGLLAVCLKETSELIGGCGLIMQLINGKIKPEIRYHIIKKNMRFRERNGVLYGIYQSDK